MPPLKITSFHQTDVGMVRKNNEDYGHADPAGRFFICSDGMGGHAAGEVASQMAVAELAANLDLWPIEFEHFADAPDPERQRDALAVIEYLLKSVNVSVHERGKAEREKRGMGCTAEVAVVVGNFVLCGHVGDSRQYLIRGANVQKLTQDHSFTPPSEPGQGPRKGMLWSAIGPHPVCTVDTFGFQIRPGDRVLQCSDGLSDYFPDDMEIAAVLNQHGDERGVRALIELAKQRGGHDNLTVVMFRADEQPAMPVGRAAFRASATAQTMAADGAPPEKRRIPPGLRTTVPQRSADSVLARRMIVFAGSPLFDGIPATEINKLLANATEVVLSSGRPIPRNVHGVDYAWMIVDGQHSGLLVYPEALATAQVSWREMFTPPDDLPAVGISRDDFRRYCLASPNAGVLMLGNVAGLVAAELRRYLDAMAPR